MAKSKLTLFFCLLFLLVSCAVPPQKLGISQQQWDQYPPTKQQNILDGYKQILTAKDNGTITPIDDSWLQLSISGGSAMMPPFTKRYTYMPVTFSIQEETCKQVLLHSDSSIHAIKLTTCYKNKALWLDPSRYEIANQDGTVRLPYSPLWENGFTYNNVTSSGYARLHNITIIVKQKPKWPKS